MRSPRARFGRLGGKAWRNVGTLRIEDLLGPAPAPFSVLRVALKPGASHPPLSHARTSEFFVVLRGSQRATIGRSCRRLVQGDFAYLPPGTVHAFEAGPRGVEVLSIFTPPLDPARPDIVMR